MKYNIAKLFAAAAALTFIVAGCSSLQEENGIAERKEIKFKASVGSFQVKATDTAFENGDVIGLFAGDPVNLTNLRLEWQDGALVPETPVYWGQEQLVDQSAFFGAYYPYDPEQEGTDFAFAVKDDQSTPEAYTASDLMFASTYATPAEGDVNLNFVHKLSKIVFNIDNKLENDAVAEVYLGNVYQVYGGDIESPNYSARGVDYVNIKAAKGYNAAGETVWSVIIPPQGANPVIMLVTESGKEYVYETDSKMYFYPSTRYNAHVILDESSVTANLNAEVVDWLDGGGFWFTQNDPSKYLGEWSIIGSIQGSEWEKDIPMYRGGDFYWYTDITYHEGEEFFFRMDGEWDVNMGLAYDTILYDWNGYKITEGGYGLKLERDGVWHIELNLLEKYVYVYRVGDLIGIEGEVVWSGSKTLYDWNTDDPYIGSEDMWLANGLQVGDEIRVYFNANGKWGLCVYDGHWGMEMLSYSGYTEGLSYISAFVSEDIYNNLTSLQYWGGGLVVFGNACEVVAVTIVRGEYDGWTMIGTIEGTNWDRDFYMTETEPGVWEYTLYITSDMEFKLRKNHSWDVNLGGDGVSVLESGIAYNLAYGGYNLSVSETGIWRVVADVNNNYIYAIRTHDENGIPVGAVNVWDSASAFVAEYWYSGTDWSGGLTPTIETLENGFRFVIPDGIGGSEWMGQNKIFMNYNLRADKNYMLEFAINTKSNSLMTLKLAEYNDDANSEKEVFYVNWLTTWGDEWNFNYRFEGSPAVSYNNGTVLILDLGRCNAGEVVTLTDIKLYEYVAL